jgi:hypothetical protein
MTIFSAAKTSIIALLLCPAPLFATTLVVLTTATDAYLGADSRAQGRSELVCKIVDSGGVAVGMSGHLGNTATQFNASESVAHALHRSSDLRSAIENVTAELQAPLETSMEWERVHALADYQAKYEGEKVLELVFVTAVNGAPRIAVVYWRAQDGHLVREGPTFHGAMYSLVVGSNTAVKAYQDSHPEWVNLPPAAIVEKFLQVEAEQEPDVVGPPFSIVQMNKSGTHWVSSGACNEAGTNE